MTIQAVYENGVFRPTELVELPEHTPVTVVTDEAKPQPAEKVMTGADLMRLSGTLKSWPEDPVTGQRRMRDEEWL